MSLIALPRPLDDLKVSMHPDELRGIMARLGYECHHDLAKAIGVSRSSISLWLNGRISVPKPVAILLRLMVLDKVAA